MNNNNSELIKFIERFSAKWELRDGYVDVSLYHSPHENKDYDLSKIAVKYGGGGHRGACGFRVSLKDAVNMGLLGGW